MKARSLLSALFILLIFTYAFSQADYVPFNSAGKIGLKDKTGNLLIPAQYEQLGWSDGSFSVENGTMGYKASGKWGILRINENQVGNPEYTTLVPAGKGLFIASKKISAVSEKTGLIDITGKTIINFEYESLKLSEDQIICLSKNGNQYRYGILTLNGHYILRPEWISVKRKSNFIWQTENTEGKYYLFNNAGSKILTSEIDSIGHFNNTWAVVYSGPFRGLIDDTGKLIATPVYKEINFNESGRPMGQRYHEWKLFTRENKILQLIEADSIKSFSGNKLRLHRNQYSQLVDENNPEKILLTANNISNPNKGYAALEYRKKFGLLDSTGRIVIHPKYDTIKNLGTIWLFAGTNSGNKSWFLVNTDKTIVIKGAWSEVTPTEKLFKIRKQGYAGLIDKNGFEIIPPVYDSIYQVTDKYISVRMLGKYGVIDYSEKWIIYPQDDPIELINDSLYFQRSKKITFLRGLPANLIYFTSNKIKVGTGNLEETLADGRIKLVSFSGVEITDQINDEKKEISSNKVDKANNQFPVTEKLQGFCQDGKFGFKDERGRLRIANRYDSIVPFSESRAGVKLLGKWGFIDPYDRLIIQPQFDKPAFFKNHYALVLKSGKLGIIDDEGQTHLNFEFDNVQQIPDQQYLIIKKGNSFGLCRFDGKLLLDPRFENIQYLGKDEVLVKRNRYGVITTNGLPVIPLIYDELKYLNSNNLFLSKRKPEPENLIR